MFSASSPASEAELIVALERPTPCAREATGHQGVAHAPVAGCLISESTLDKRRALPAIGLRVPMAGCPELGPLVRSMIFIIQTADHRRMNCRPPGLFWSSGRRFARWLVVTFGVTLKRRGSTAIGTHRKPMAGCPDLRPLPDRILRSQTSRSHFQIALGGASPSECIRLLAAGSSLNLPRSRVAL
jgi:hypothetical protein